MKDLIALTIGNNKYILEAPSGVPKGGLEDGIFPIISYIISLLLVVVTIASLFMIIASGIQWSTSGGDEKKLEAAKGRLKYSIIGLIVALSSFGIIQLIAKFFGIGRAASFPF